MPPLYNTGESKSSDGRDDRMRLVGPRSTTAEFGAIKTAVLQEPVDDPDFFIRELLSGVTTSDARGPSSGFGRFVESQGGAIPGLPVEAAQPSRGRPARPYQGEGRRRIDAPYLGDDPEFYENEDPRSGGDLEDLDGMDLSNFSGGVPGIEFEPADKYGPSVFDRDNQMDPARDMISNEADLVVQDESFRQGYTNDDGEYAYASRRTTSAPARRPTEASRVDRLRALMEGNDE